MPSHWLFFFQLHCEHQSKFTQLFPLVLSKTNLKATVTFLQNKKQSETELKWQAKNNARANRMCQVHSKPFSPLWPEQTIRKWLMFLYYTPSDGAHFTVQGGKKKRGKRLSSSEEFILGSCMYQIGNQQSQEWD